MKQTSAEHIIQNLFNENFHSMVFTSFNIVKDYDQAKDIVQNVFVKVWQNYEGVKYVKNLKSYLFTAVRNSSLNYLRDQKLVGTDVSEFDKIASVEEENQNQTDLTNEIHKAVEKLPDKWKEAFILSKYERLKYHEIAEEMNISNKTVEKYISKALNFLRLELGLLIFVFLYLFFSQKV